MHVVIAGASGFLGTHLTDHLRERGHRVTRLVRREPEGRDESRWDPETGEVDQDLIEGSDVVVNLAGASIASNPHSAKKAQEVLDSRVQTTRVLAAAIAACDEPPAFLAGNGISWYGDHGTLEVTEQSDSRGEAHLTTVARAWQEAAMPAARNGSRTCILRTAPVMDAASSPLRELRRVFQLALGARLGNGQQFFPMISLRDWVGAVTHLAESPDAAGAFNLCCPLTPTNGEFTQALADAVHRPAFLVAPAFALKIAAGRMVPELLGSVNALPVALEAAGYDFRDRDVTDVVAAGLAKAR